LLASTHPDRPSEALTREQAVIAYTATSAYAEFAEKDKGTLEPGKLADLAVLSQDIFSVPTQELPKTESVLTMVGGKVVYDSGVLHRNERDSSRKTREKK
jgi:predicted amidohydrolase YtcJ